MKHPPLTGMILAGGKSSRMGQDKASILWQEKSLLEHAVALLKPFCSEILILSSKPEHEIEGTTRIADLSPNMGPSGGMVSGLEIAKNEWTLLHLVDMPLVDTELITNLLQYWEAGFEAIHFQDGDNPRHYPCLYHRSAITHFRPNLERKNEGIRKVLRRMKVKLIATDRIFEEQFGPAFSNVNTPEDLKQIMKNG